MEAPAARTNESRTPTGTEPTTSNLTEPTALNEDQVVEQIRRFIADLLDADLDDGETLSALHLALLAHGR